MLSSSNPLTQIDFAEFSFPSQSLKWIFSHHLKALSQPLLALAVPLHSSAPFTGSFDVIICAHSLYSFSFSSSAYPSQVFIPITPPNPSCHSREELNSGTSSQSLSHCLTQLIIPSSLRHSTLFTWLPGTRIPGFLLNSRSFSVSCDCWNLLSSSPLLVRTQSLSLPSCLVWASLVAQMVKRLPSVQETRVWSLGWEDPLEKEMATHSSTLVWKIPRAEEPGRLHSMGSQRVGHDWAISVSCLIYSSLLGVATSLILVSSLVSSPKTLSFWAINLLYSSLSAYLILFRYLVKCPLISESFSDSHIWNIPLFLINLWLLSNST